MVVERWRPVAHAGTTTKAQVNPRGGRGPRSATAACEAGPMDQRVSLVTLGVSDIARARSFYEDLGWSGETPDGDVIFFQAGGMIVALWGRDQLARDSAVVDSGGWGGVTLAYNARSPEEVDAILASAERAGASIGRAGAPTEWGGYSGIFVDPDGHPWEVAHNPGWRLDDDGTVHLR